MERTLEVTIKVKNKLHDLLLAELADFDFNAFEEGDGFIKAYGTGKDWRSIGREAIREWLKVHEETVDISESWTGSRNWNEKWAKQVEPIVVGPFFVKPTSYEVPETHQERLVIEVEPKMTFGTGQHASTQLLLRLLPQWVQTGDRILDAGAGTGILSVAAIRLGAKEAIAYDNHPGAEENARETLVVNQVDDRVDYRIGELDVVPESGFSGVVANINRNVLVKLLPQLAAKLNPGGYIMISGLMQDSRPQMERTAEENGLKVVDAAEEAEWYALVLQQDT